MAQTASRTSGWDAVRSRVGPRVLTAILALGAAAGFIFGGLGTVDPQPSPFWTPAALFAAFLAAEATHLHIEFRRQNNSISLSEIPLIVGLFFVDPLTLLLVRLLAAATVAVLQHRPLVKALFNLALFSAEVVVASLVFYAFPTHDITQPESWLAAVAALFAVLALTVTAMQGVILLTEGPQPWAKVGLNAMLSALIVALNGAVALVVVMVLHISPWSGLVLAVLCAVLLVAYRAYARSFRQHASLRRVYGFSRLLELTRSSEAPLDTALNEARDVLNASTITMRLIGERPLSIMVDGDGRASTPPPLEPDDPISTRARGSRSGFLLSGRKAEAALAARGAREIIAVPLRSGPDALGHIEFSDRQSSMSRYTSEDVQVADTLATRLTAAIENQDLVARLRHAAYHDLLTGLPTRARLGQHLDAAIEGSSAGDGVVALVQLDLDRFKEVNDSLGHTWGDELLVLVGQRLSRSSPDGAVVARVGADEFAVTVRVPGASEAAELAATLRDAVSTSYPLAGLTIDASATVGVALAPDHGSDSPTLMRRVDVALSNAKNVGRRVSMYDPSMEQESLQRLRLVTELRTALAAGQVVVRYQPKINLRSRDLVGVEALVRWNHPEYGEVAPDRFVPLAEVTGLIGILTDHVLRASLAQCRQWLDRDLRIPVAVNLSARSLSDAEFPDRVAGMLREYDVPADLLSFELTESSVMSDPDRMQPVLLRLHDLGTGLSIDDFGTGYSSLSQLRRLPVDEVKIDKEFVFTMGTDLGDLAIVRAIIELAHSLALRVVAEGVEDELARDLLAGNDCDVIQGYLVSRALDPDRLDAWLSARTAIRPGLPGVKGRRLQLLTG
jgi:diguanylate cyclase (GGDEF)-like protein